VLVVNGGAVLENLKTAAVINLDKWVETLLAELPKE
jgi:hypothetical protein